MTPNDFVEFCINLKYYLSLDIIPLPEYKVEYLNSFLFCKIGKLIAAFGHSNSDYEKIIENWDKRKERVNYNNIVVICTDRNILNNLITRCDDNVVKKFGEIPYKKVLFTTKKYSYEYTAYLKSFCNEQACPEATRPSITRKGKYILEEDGFDLDKFILG